tara:strand:- start:986 stop:1573 length:588 start_codon:yes stop_codon:yes gene_type:complete
MDKKFIIKIIITLIAILLVLIFFSYYFSEKNNLDSLTKVKESENIKSKTNGNIIKDIRYYSENKDGDSYLIFSDYGKIDLNNTNLTYMTNVTAIINVKKSEEIKIKSKFANFNHISYETEFFENVIITRGIEKITSEKLEFSLEKNLIVLSKDVILKKPGFNLKADKVEIDLITKNSKITMNDKEKKIIFLGKNK